MEISVTVLLLTVTAAQGSQLEGPQNTLSVVGSNVTLKCLFPSRNCSGVDWVKHIAGSPKSVFRYPGGITGDYRKRYSIDKSFGCDLVIRTVELTDAGRFLCRAIISSRSVEKTAYLIILDTHPKCTTNASMNNTVEEDGLQLNCVVTYNGTNKVSMVWKGVEDSSTAAKNETQAKCKKIAPQDESEDRDRTPATGEVTYNGTNRASINASLNGTVEEDEVQLDQMVTYNETATTSMAWKRVEEDGKTICRSHLVVASGPEVPLFTCITSFTIQTIDSGTTIAGLAKNIPNTTCTTSAIKVLYSVRNVTLSPSRSYYSSGEVLNCTAKGHPSPTFKWQEMENGSTWIDIQSQIGSEFSMNNVSSKLYRCVAMNVVRNKSYNATSQEFLVNNADSDSNGSFRAITIISVSVFLLLLIILLVICFCHRVYPGYKFCHSRNKPMGNIREEQPLPENPDTCIYSVVNKKQNAHPKAKIGLASTSESPKLPQGATPQAMPRTDKSKAGHTNTYQHEEVTYADLAIEFGPRKVVPKYNPVPEETLYAAVGTA